MSQVTKPECRSPKVLEPTIDRFGWPIRRPWPGEEGQHVSCASLQCSPQPPQLNQPSRQTRRQNIDDSLQELLAFATVLGPVSSHDVLIDGPGDFDFGEVRISKETGDSLLLSPREQVRARVQRPPRSIQRILRPSPTPSCLLLDAAANVIKGIAGELDDVERIHDFDSIGHLTCTVLVSRPGTKVFDIADELGGLRRDIGREHELVPIDLTHELS